MLFKLAKPALFLSAAVGLLIGCENVSPEALAQRAEQAIENKQYQAAIVDLRSLLQDEPQNARARWLLGEVYLRTGNGPPAEKELRRAMELGVEEASVAPLLGRALLLQSKFDEVLALPISRLVGAAAGELAASRGLAFLGKGQVEAARDQIDSALAFAPDSVDVRYAQARLLVAEVHPDEALVVLDSIHESHPEYAPAWTLKGDMLGERREFAEAEQAYTKAMEFGVAPLEDRIKRGFARLAQGKVEEASKDAVTLSKQAPRSSQVQYLNGLIHIEKQEWTAAKEALDQAYAQTPNNHAIVIALASTEAALGNVNRARELAEKALGMMPGHVPSRKLMTRLHLEEQEGGKAESLVRPVVQAYPEDLEAKRLLARSLYLQGKVDEASRLSTELAAQDQESAQAQAQAGIGLMASGARDEGLAALKRAVELAPEQQAYTSLLIAGLVEDGAKAEAAAIAEEFAKQKPGDPEALNLLAFTHLANEDATNAKVIFARVLELDPANQKAARTLASLALSEGDPKAALAYLKPALEASPNDSRLLLLGAEAARREGQTQEVEALLNRALEANPAMVQPRVSLARLLLAKNEAAKALSVLTPVASQLDADVMLFRADALVRLGRQNEARTELETLTRIAPGNAEAHFALAQIYDDLGDRSAVAEELDKVLALSPTDTRAQLAQARLMAMEGRVKEAEAIIDEVDLPVNDTRVLAARLAVANAAERRDEAIEYARKLYAAQPSARSAVMLSRAQVKAGQMGSGVETLEGWLETYPQDVPVITELANVFLEQRQLGLYLDQLRRILDVDSGSVLALNNLAWYLRREAPREALGYARRAYEQSPSSPAVIDTFAVVLAENKDFDGALRMITKAADLAKEPAPFRIRRAEILIMAGNNEQAVGELNELLGGPLPDMMRKEAENLLRQARG